MWAVDELIGADLGDSRLNDRLIRLVGAISKQPEMPIPQVCGKAGAKAAYRFFDNSCIKPEDILAPHTARTVKRAAEFDVVLAPQDTTTWSLNHHPGTKGLGPICEQRDSLGMLIHSTLLLSPDGVPLGIIDQQVWARSLENFGRRSESRKKPIEEKESYCWLSSLTAVQQTLPNHPHVVVIGDREADIFDLFAAPRRPGVELLVRVNYLGRKVDHQAKYLKNALAEAPVQGTIRVELPRGDDRPSRHATLKIRWATISILPPRNHCERRKFSPIPLQFILAEEIDAPPGQKPVCWLLATTLPVENIEDAARSLTWYTSRWRIERFHFVLKSGCRIEDLQLETAERLQRALPCFSIIAWRLLWLTYEARKNPEQSCTVILETHEWQPLHATIHRDEPIPREAPNLGIAIRMIAQLGGFLARKRDGEPGVKTLWRGMRRLNDISYGWKLATNGNSPPDHVLHVGNG
jgi:hypothetical protein